MTYKKHRAVRTRDWSTCAVKYAFTQTLISIRERTYLHLERALAVIQEDDAQPELGLFGDPGHGGEAAESPAPPLVLLHVRVSLRRSAKNPPSLPPSRELLQKKRKKKISWCFTRSSSASSSSSSSPQGSVAAAGARSLRMLDGTLTFFPETEQRLVCVLWHTEPHCNGVTSILQLPFYLNKVHQ